MNDISLKLSERAVTGKKVSQRREDGMLPSVVYGGSMEAIATESPFVETVKVARTAGRHTPVHLTIGKKKQLAIIKNIDIDAVKNSIRHIEFHAIKQNEAIVTEVPVKLEGVGESEAEKAGLVVLQTIEALDIKALPADLPEALTVDITSLVEVGDRLTVTDIELPRGVELVQDEDLDDLVVANVYEPSALQAANEAVGGDAEDEEEVESEHGESQSQQQEGSEGTTDNKANSNE